MTKKVHLIHGIHTSKDDVSTPELLIPTLLKAGYAKKDIVIHEYGYALGVTSRWANDDRAKKILPLINPGDTIIAHSNGCLITKILLEMGALPSGITLLQPALDVDTLFSIGGYWINVFYNAEDTATLVARFFLWFKHPYGAMGRYGYKGFDQRVLNYDTIEICGKGGHSKPYAKSELLRQVVINMAAKRD